ncbi:MAG: hypothetical protein AAFU65_16975 [Pseudomonadota bacterium]
MKRYNNTHLWLLIPFAVAVLGFIPSYWLRFFEVPWRHHVHGLTATLWFILLITQPYLISRGRRDAHRRFGMLALIVAGAVVASGINLVPYNLVNDRIPEFARFGLSFVDVVLVPGFALAVIMAVLRSKQTDDHAHWMISTVFWAVSPALFRLLLGPAFALGAESFDAVVPYVLGSTGVVNIVVLAFLMFRERRMHPAYVLAALGSIVLFLPTVVGNMGWWRAIASAVFTV